MLLFYGGVKRRIFCYNGCRCCRLVCIKNSLSCRTICETICLSLSSNMGDIPVLLLLKKLWCLYSTSLEGMSPSFSASGRFQIIFGKISLSLTLIGCVIFTESHQIKLYKNFASKTLSVWYLVLFLKLISLDGNEYVEKLFYVWKCRIQYEFAPLYPQNAMCTRLFTFF